jgi:formate dehydrogenase subunit gamma
MGDQSANVESVELTVAEFVDNNPATADQLLPLLHSVQQAHGYVPLDAMAGIASALNISRAEVFGVMSFYDDFVTEPRSATVEICGAEACQSLGCRSLLAEAAAGLEPGVTVREVFCLGNCAVGPSVRIGNRVLGRATLSRIQAALDGVDP